MATSTEEVVKYPPPGAQWKWINPNQQGIQNLGEFAVKEQNRRRHWNMGFDDVYQSWKMVLASDAGDMYLLCLNADKNEITLRYEAIVWAEATEDNKLILVSFRGVV